MPDHKLAEIIDMINEGDLNNDDYSYDTYMINIITVSFLISIILGFIIFFYVELFFIITSHLKEVKIMSLKKLSKMYVLFIKVRKKIFI